MAGVMLLSLVLAAWSAVASEGKLLADESSTPYVLKFENPRKEFEQWKRTFGQRYEDDWNEEYRFHIFQKNLATIEQHNWKYHTKESSFYMGVNAFAAMDQDELRRYTGFSTHSRRLSMLKGNSVFECQPMDEATSSLKNIPDELDWSAKGYTTPVKDQGSDCGSCWTFGATGAMEGAYFKTHKKLVSFSEQQILDCCKDDGCGNCTTGGSPQSAFGYIIEAGGIDAEDSYPYKAMVEPECHYNKSTAVGRIKACYNVTPSGNETALQKACAAHGPITVAIDALSSEFAMYAGGVFENNFCHTNSECLDHAVLLVGYGVKEDQPYWKIKNSWGTWWGVEGYALMRRNYKNMCGIATDANYVVME